MAREPKPARRSAAPREGERRMGELNGHWTSGAASWSGFASVSAFCELREFRRSRSRPMREPPAKAVTDLAGVFRAAPFAGIARWPQDPRPHRQDSLNRTKGGAGIMAVEAPHADARIRRAANAKCSDARRHSPACNGGNSPQRARARRQRSRQVCRDETTDADDDRPRDGAEHQDHGDV